MCPPEPMDHGWPHYPLLTSSPLPFHSMHCPPAFPHSRSRRTRASTPTPEVQTLKPETCNLKLSASRHGGDEPTVDWQGDTGNVRAAGESKKAAALPSSAGSP